MSAGAGELGELLRASLAHPAVAAQAVRTEATANQFDAANLVAETTWYEGERFVGVLSPSTLAAPPLARDVSRYAVAYQLPVDFAGAIAAARWAGVTGPSRQVPEPSSLLLVGAGLVASAWRRRRQS